MPIPEHTDPTALDKLYNLTGMPMACRPWYSVVWTWIKEELFKEPLEAIEPISQDGPIRRRIRVHRRAARLATRLHRLDQDEAREVIQVTTVLLGFKATVRITRRPVEARR